MLLATTELLVVVVLAIVFGILAAIVGASPASGSYLLELRVEQLGGQVITIVVLAFLVVQAYHVRAGLPGAPREAPAARRLRRALGGCRRAVVVNAAP